MPAQRAGRGEVSGWHDDGLFVDHTHARQRLLLLREQPVRAQLLVLRPGLAGTADDVAVGCLDGMIDGDEVAVIWGSHADPFRISHSRRWVAPTGIRARVSSALQC